MGHAISNNLGYSKYLTLKCKLRDWAQVAGQIGYEMSQFFRFDLSDY